MFLPLQWLKALSLLIRKWGPVPKSEGKFIFQQKQFFWTVITKPQICGVIIIIIIIDWYFEIYSLGSYQFSFQKFFCGCYLFTSCGVCHNWFFFFFALLVWASSKVCPTHSGGGRRLEASWCLPSHQMGRQEESKAILRILWAPAGGFELLNTW